MEKIHHFDEFEVGQTLTSPPFSFNQEEIIHFSERYDPQPMHTDPDGAKDSIIGKFIASGWHTAAYTIHMLISNFIAIPGGMVGLEVNGLRWKLPVHPDEELRAEVEILEKRLMKSRPGFGLVTYQCRVKNPEEAIVLEMTTTTMVRSK